MTYPARDRTDHPEIQAPPTERLVPEDERTLPTAKKTVLLLSTLSAVLSIAGGFVCFQLENEMLGLILAILGLVAGAVAWVMARGDARTGSVTPAVASITAAVFCVVIGMDLADVEDAAENPSANPITVPGTGGQMAIPEDPAAIVDPDRAKPTTQP